MIISRTPLRVSFVGGGTDLPVFCEKDRGAVVSTAIKKYVYIVIHPSFDENNLIAYSKIERTPIVENIANPLVREAMKMTGITKGIELHSIAEIPAGTGLGGSSSFTVGLLNALYAYQGKYVSAEKLAREACEIEIDILKEPIGRQDQYAAAFGGLNKIDFFGSETRLRPLIFNPKIKKGLEEKLMMFYLGEEERSASLILKNQRDQLNNNENLLNYYIQMRNLADEMEENLRDNKIEKFGELLHKNWLLKQNLSNDISNNYINNFYLKALNAGATGGKLLGAGGSGFLLIYSDKENQNNVRNSLEGLKEYKLNFDNEGSRIIYVGD
jgi:D-glycero-alpha-D-manno-heptose-7-phosphate kinase